MNYNFEFVMSCKKLLLQAFLLSFFILAGIFLFSGVSKAVSCEPWDQNACCDMGVINALIQEINQVHLYAQSNWHRNNFNRPCGTFDAFYARLVAHIYRASAGWFPLILFKESDPNLQMTR